MDYIYIRFWLSRTQGFDLRCSKCSISLSTQSVYIYDIDTEVLSLYVLNFDSLVAPVRIEFIRREEAGIKFACYNDIALAFRDYQIPYFKEI